MIINEFQTIKKMCEVASEDFESRFFDPVGEEEIINWQNQYNRTLPEELAEFLKLSNGAVIRGNLAHIYGLESFEVGNEEFPDEWVIIGDLLGDGERLAFSVEDGRILRINHGMLHPYATLAEFLNTMVIRMLTQDNRKLVYQFNEKSVQERKAYLKILGDRSVDEYFEFIDDLRDVAIQDFWTNERELIDDGQSTRNWSVDQIEAIYNISIETGKRRTFGGAAIFEDNQGRTHARKHGSQVVLEEYDVHQMLSFDAFPEYAGIAKNLQALGRYNNEHIYAHRGNYRNTTHWYYDPESGAIHDFAN